MALLKITKELKRFTLMKTKDPLNMLEWCCIEMCYGGRIQWKIIIFSGRKGSGRIVTRRLNGIFIGVRARLTYFYGCWYALSLYFGIWRCPRWTWGLLDIWWCSDRSNSSEGRWVRVVIWDHSSGCTFESIGLVSTRPYLIFNMK